MALFAQWLVIACLRLFVSTRICQAELAEDECPVLLLQTSAGLQRQSVMQAPAEDSLAARAARLEAAKPLQWLHVPKTGSSIANALLRLPGVCTNISDELGNESFGVTSASEGHDWDLLDWDSCEALNPPPLGREQFGSHEHIGNESVFSEHYDGHGVTMLRQPEQRVISGMRHLAYLNNATVESVLFSEGCAARLLSGEHLDYVGSDAQAACFGVIPNVSTFGNAPREVPPPLSAADVATAVTRLRKFAFVGIQEEWHVSVCLLHAIFGGECNDAEFQNVRLGQMRQNDSGRRTSYEAVFAAPEPYDTSILGGWVDAADRAVYEVGLEMFHSMCAEHDVSAETCRPCFEAAGLL